MTREGRRVFGLHAAETAVEHGAEKVINAWVDAHRTDARLTRLRQILSDSGIRWKPATKRRLDEMSRGGNHQGVVLELDLPKERDEDDLYAALAAFGSVPLLLVLDQVQDPHNLGACLRTADGAGVIGVVVPKDQSVGLTPTVAKVASGAAETVPVYRVTNLARCLDQLKKSGLWVVGAVGNAERSVFESDLTLPLALVLGAEGRGLRRLTQDKCDWTMSIPMAGTVDSLNVSVAAGVLLYETVRQRLAHSSAGK